MKSSRNFWRSLSLLTLIAALCGAMAVPLLASVRAAPAQANVLDVVINEVAWGGTAASTSDEWIELYNNTSSNIDLSNWTIVTSDGTPGTITIPSGKIIPGNGYFLLERAETAVSDITADYVYGGSNFANGGESLSLFDELSNLIDTSNSNGGAWPGGSGSPTFASMERVNNLTADSDTNWTSNDNITVNGLDANNNPLRGTPKQVNSATLALTPSPTPLVTDTPIPTPTSVPPLAVLINEVAWAGTIASSADEWFELYNPGATNIILNGWRLTADDGNPDIALSGTVLAGDYFVVARYSAVFSDLTVDLTYSSGTFDNAGEILYLLDSNGNQVDTANIDGGSWPAGLGSPTYASMERLGVVPDSSTAWATYAGTVPIAHDRNNNDVRGTPGQANWITTVTVTPSPTMTLTKTPTFTRTITFTRTPTKVPTASRTPTSAPAQLVAINEFVPRPGRDWNNDGLINTGDEFIEVINHGTISVNLSGWTLDDEANTGSKPFVLPSRVLQPGERIVFYSSQTGLLLSDGGDGVRLLKPNGALIDAFNYTVVNYPDQSICRLPDNGGLDDWNQNCYPTPGLRNSLGSAPGPSSSGDDSLCPVADTLPLDFYLAECNPFGNNIWSRFYWDNTGWYGEMNLPEYPGKWQVFVD